MRRSARSMRGRRTCSSTRSRSRSSAEPRASISCMSDRRVLEAQQRASREEILRWWEEGWSTALGAVQALTPDDLGRIVTIRGEAFLVTEALNRSVSHTAYHVGQ